MISTSFRHQYIAILLVALLEAKKYLQNAFFTYILEQFILLTIILVMKYDQIGSQDYGLQDNTTKVLISSVIGALTYF